jgi:uncharacterized protein YbcC (UPF0753/DUF2309 family)
MSHVEPREPSSTEPRASKPPLSRHEALVIDLVEKLAKWLPEQRPLGVFVHQNPLGLIEHEHFHAACEAATRIRGARTTLTAEQYRDLKDARHIRPEDVAAAKRRISGLRLKKVDLLPRPGAGTVLLSRVRPEMAVEVGEMVDALLLRVLPTFLDLGSAPWPMPGREHGLLGVLRRLARTPLGVPEPWLAGLRETLGGDDATAMSRIVACLEKRGDPDFGWPSVIHDALFELPGYAGMIHRLEHHPEEQPKGVKISLLDYLAARLIIEEHALMDVTHRLFGPRATLATLAASLSTAPTEPPQVMWSEDLAAFQDAFEEDYVRSLVGAMTTLQAHPIPRLPNPNVHYVCCIDDRCESIRRHIEECVPRSATIGSAGFFGIALKHRAPLSSDETFSCPAPVTPEKRVTEELPAAERAALESARKRDRSFAAVAGDDASRRALGGVLASFTNFARAPKTLVRLLFPELFVDHAHEFEGTRLVYSTEEDPQGFSHEDQANLVYRNLATIGVLEGFGRWMLIVGHGSMGVNNPFLSGYQCGACGGQRGGINARVFCAFANDPKNRKRLIELGAKIPDDTIFVPGEHDTSLDRIRWFGLEDLPADRQKELAIIRAGIDQALDRNARERARRFDDIPLDLPLADSVLRVRRRTADFAETRPEYNHATNAACVLGRRKLTRGLFLDRRPFLVEYNPLIDDERGSTLERLMAAPLPVCAGISHEYFFSTMDPERWGCGTKLPHNVQGLLGVSNGADGDLRPGLWRQTTEIHEPVRLVTVIDAEPEKIAAVLDRLPPVKNTVVNAWIHLFACSPSGRGFFRWVGDGFQPYDALPHALMEVSSSLDACLHTRENVAPCMVVGGEYVPGASS